MNERFIRCSECGLPHEEGLRVCPSTGRAIVRPPPGRAASVRAPPPAPPPPPPAHGVPPPRAGTSDDDSVDLELVGTLVGGKYRVRDVLGHGGMGTVFEAVREGLGNTVAIKVLHPNQLQKKDAVQRFHQEARAAARIGHPNICEVYDVGTLDDGRPYLVMDRLTGVTLADRIQSLGGLPFQEVLDTLTQVLSGLHAAHEKGIIHRDVKPENVFLSERVGCPPLAKILDFGVSKVMSQSSGGGGGFSEVEVTRTGVVLGTPYYLAPEQARGERNLDARVDLYACGVMLYESLTGRRPFRAPNYNALLIAILTGTPRPAREIRPDLPPGFGRVLDRSIEREPNDRYQTALDFQAALQPYSQNPLAPRAPPPSRPPPRRSSVFPPPPRGAHPEPDPRGGFVEQRRPAVLPSKCVGSASSGYACAVFGGCGPARAARASPFSVPSFRCHRRAATLTVGRSALHSPGRCVPRAAPARAARAAPARAGPAAPASSVSARRLLARPLSNAAASKSVRSTPAGAARARAGPAAGSGPFDVERAGRSCSPAPLRPSARDRPGCPYSACGTRTEAQPELRRPGDRGGPTSQVRLARRRTLPGRLLERFPSEACVDPRASQACVDPRASPARVDPRASSARVDPRASQAGVHQP